ncbi:YncE family protein [Methylobacterium sp. J-068]|uniref:YncE family protein n=1 Tax=Methylobacterium sp. J-068 TaxID=2836649 RepID=UPI001FB96EB5|nr:YncE family protein [Methylobacterium sp. J-068]MCJ2035608.1 YncE family protein [Methylobacterium sp. J-068]
MTRSLARTLRTAALLAFALPSTAIAESPAFILVGLDGKTFFEAQGGRNGPNGHDAVGIVDVSDEARPRLVHTLPLDNSVYGPPTNLRVTPDGRLGLVASSVLMRQEGTAWYAQADNRLHVIDLAALPPRLIETVTVGLQPSGLAISRAGDLAVVANREGRSVTALTIRGTVVRPVMTVDVGDEAAAVAFAPDGRRAFLAKNKVGKIGVLAIDGTTLSYDRNLDMPVGPGVYGLDVTPDGKLALTGNTGPEPSDGHADTVSVIRADAQRPVVIDHVGIGDTPEALAIAPDGRHAAVSVVRGASAPQGSPGYTPSGVVALLAIDPNGLVRRVAEAEAGAVTQGIVFSPSGAYVYVGNYVDRTLGVYRVTGDTLTDTGTRVSLPGQPASLGGR